MDIGAAVVAGTLGTVAIAITLSSTLDEINDLQYLCTQNAIDLEDPMNGEFIPLYSLDEERFYEKTIARTNVLHQESPEEEMWKNVPHVRAIREYGLQRKGFYHLYWPYSPMELHTLFLEWLHSVPMESPLHERGNYAETFVELHRHYFVTGLTGRLRDRLS